MSVCFSLNKSTSYLSKKKKLEAKFMSWGLLLILFLAYFVHKACTLLPWISSSSSVFFIAEHYKKLNREVTD